MPEIVSGGDVYAGLELAVLATAGEAPTYPTRWRRVPLAGDSMRFEQIALVESPEFNQSGLSTGDKFGYGVFRGTFTTRFYYNADWFHWLMSAVHGGLEVLNVDKLVNGNAAPGGGSAATNVHSYFLQSFRNTAAGSIGAIPVGIALRLHKDAAGQSIEEINPAHIVGATIRQAERGWLTVEWEVVGVKPTLIVSPGILPVASGDYAVRPGDLDRDGTHPVLPSLCAIVSGTVQLLVDAFEIRIANSIARAAPPTSVISQVMRAGHIASARYTGSITARMHDTSFDSPQPQATLVASGGVANLGFIFGLRLRYISKANGVAETDDVKNADNPNNVPYAVDIWLQQAMATPADASLRDKGSNSMTWNIISIHRSIGSSGTALAASYQYATGALIQFQVAPSDEPSADAKFDSWSGNNPHASLS